mgnify:CR=1 FL=1
MKTPNQLLAFYYKNQLYIRAIPAKCLFRSTMIHEVINRGDVLALHVETQQLTIIPGKADVTHAKIDCTIPLTIDDLFGDLT